MPASIEQNIKSQFEKVFEQNDWRTFKSVAEYYFKKAATLKTRDIESHNNQRLIRNIQKRLFLGVGGELLVKAYFLKNGYYINRPADREIKSKLIEFNQLKTTEMDKGDTFSFNDLLSNLNKISELNNWNSIQKGLRTLKVFRNKEGHTVTTKHKFEQATYDDIEVGVTQMYKDGFSQNIEFKISMKPNERGVFKRV